MFRVTAPGSEAIRMWDGNGWWNIPCNDECCENGIYEYESGYNNPGEYTFVVQATYSSEHPDWDSDWGDFRWEDMDWAETSNPVMVIITSKGELAAPNFTLNKTELAWGEDLIATVTDDTITTMDGQPVADENWYFVNLFKLIEDENDSRWDGFHMPMNLYVDENNQVRIPTYVLDGDGIYEIRIGADAIGWENHENSIRFTVGPEADVTEEPYKDFHVSKENIVTLEQTMLYVYQTGAEWYDVEIRKKGDPDWEDGRDSGGPVLAKD